MTQLSIKTRAAASMLLVVAVGLGIWTADASAVSCFGGPASSALNQYCESIPNPTGRHGAAGGTPALAKTLPKRIVNQITGTSTTPSVAASGSRRSVSVRTRATGHRAKARAEAAARARLLSLPAATGRLRSADFKGESAADVWAPFSWLLAVLGGIALVLAVTAFAVSRRRSAGD